MVASLPADDSITSPPPGCSSRYSVTLYTWRRGARRQRRPGGTLRGGGETRGGGALKSGWRAARTFPCRMSQQSLCVVCFSHSACAAGRAAQRARRGGPRRQAAKSKSRCAQPAAAAHQRECLVRAVRGGVLSLGLRSAVGAHCCGGGGAREARRGRGRGGRPDSSRMQAQRARCRSAAGLRSRARAKDLYRRRAPRARHVARVSPSRFHLAPRYGSRGVLRVLSAHDAAHRAPPARRGERRRQVRPPLSCSDTAALSIGGLGRGGARASHLATASPRAVACDAASAGCGGRCSLVVCA